MWPLPVVSRDQVSIVFAPGKLILSWIRPSGNEKKKFELKAHQTILLRNSDLEHAIIFNPTHIKKEIIGFLDTYGLVNASVAIALAGDVVIEKIVKLPVATPNKKDFSISSTEKIVWGSVYLHPTSSGNFLFYMYSIQQSYLFQYKLLAINTPFNLICLVPGTAPLLYLYAYLRGRLFRHGDLINQNSDSLPTAQTLFSINTLNKILYTPASLQINKETQLCELTTALGLHLLGAPS